ncbi:hypothetical protein DPMN_095566 [Dreissena polymorpha]|uniref:Uncharacterized protein n=1 Tax=Dreissena polymorpha TaxID=45954 RepID=A0A9D4L747_DREPO|nr:hypothetical protein DPMN_095566 [Dreissena polymorpha]
MSDYTEYPNFNLILEDSDFETEVNEQIANTQDVVELSYEDFQAKFGFDARVLFDFDNELEQPATDMTDNLVSENIPINDQNKDSIRQETSKSNEFKDVNIEHVNKYITDQENKNTEKKHLLISTNFADILHNKAKQSKYMKFPLIS